MTRGLAYGVDFNCLKRDHFKKWNSLATKAHSPEGKVILLFRRVLLLPFLVPTFGSILESLRSFRAALRPWPGWDAAPGELQSWLDVL